MLGRLWLGVFAIPWWLGAVAEAAPPHALDKPAFTAPPGELLAAGKAALSGDWPVIILREQVDVSYDDRARSTMHWRWVFVVQTQAGVDDWGTIRSSWRPFHQDRPVFRARVIDPAGRVAELDPALVTDAPVAGGSGNVFSDRRHIEAPLPRLQVGAVVEEEVVTTDREPLLSAGDVNVSVLGNDVPTASSVISYSAPVARKLHHVERKLPAGVRTRHQIAGGRESWVYEVPALPAHPVLESGVPSDIVTIPYVGVGTAASWAAVARAYRALLDQRIAEGAVTWPAELPRAASLESVNAITRWLHHQIRYTGIEFGDAALVPWPPAEVVKRGFGDCKDKATLLVALLRQAGVRADLALLATGPGSDVDPDLPGVGVFDHAIVRARLDSRDVWIDATDDLARPGQLPSADQGRHALVIADDTTGLSATPVAAPADNAIREVRTFVAAEQGPAQATEVSRATGVLDEQLRNASRDVRADDMQKTYGEYVESRYGGKLDRITANDPADLATPFEMTIAVKDAHRVYTDREQIDVYLYPRSTFHELPVEVSSSDDKSAPPRTNDFAWFTPHIYEVENRIVVPTGFTLPAATPARTRAIGTATFTESRRVDGQTLIVTFRLDTGKPRVTAAELAALRTALGDLGKEDVHLQIPHTGFALEHAGKPREAIAECRRLIALHPREALHHAQLATVLLRAGAGEAARREARAAVALEPTSADPLAVLGWVLRFDTLGREFTYDWDRAGAIAALQKARKLDPKHAGAASMLAEVLARDPAGRLLEADADLRGAADAWRAALAIEKSDESTLALTEALLRSERFAEAESTARSAAQSQARDKWIVAAVAGASGAKQAIQVASDLGTGAARTELIDGAASVMLLLRRYDVARELFAETGSSARRSPSQAALLDIVTSHPPLRSGTSDPRSAMVDVLLTTIDARRQTPAFWDAELERRFRQANTLRIPDALRNAGALRFLGDLLESGTTIKLEEGQPGQWRATAESQGHQLRAYLLLERGVVKLVGTSDSTAAIGRYVLRARGAAEQARARTLLDWLRGDADKATDRNLARFKRLWGSGMPSSPEAMALAGAVLAAETDPDRTIAIASRCATTLPDGELACHEVLVDAYLARRRWADVAAELDKIVQLAPDRGAAALALRSHALALAGRCDDAGKLVDDSLAKDPDDHDALVARFWVAVACGPSRDVLLRADVVVKHPRVRPADLNNVAWYRLVTGNDLPAALDLARKAVARAPQEATPVSTLAAIEAEAGELGHAIEDNAKAMSLHDTPEPSSADWYVIGRIYEQLDLRDDAAAAYKRVTHDVIEVLSSYELAQKRLAALPHR